MKLISARAFYSNLHVYCNYSFSRFSRFYATAKYPDGIATRPFTRCSFVCFAVETIIYAFGTLKHHGLYRPVYHGVPENSSAKKSWHTRYSLFCCAYEHMFISWSELVCPCLCGRDCVVMFVWPDLSGRRCMPLIKNLTTTAPHDNITAPT